MKVRAVTIDTFPRISLDISVIERNDHFVVTVTETVPGLSPFSFVTGPSPWIRLRRDEARGPELMIEGGLYLAITEASVAPIAEFLGITVE